MWIPSSRSSGFQSRVVRGGRWRAYRRWVWPIPWCRLRRPHDAYFTTLRLYYLSPEADELLVHQQHGLRLSLCQPNWGKVRTLGQPCGLLHFSRTTSLQMTLRAGEVVILSGPRQSHRAAPAPPAASLYKKTQRSARGVGRHKSGVPWHAESALCQNIGGPQ